MRKTVFAINSTIDGYCNHTDVIADDELHEYYTKLLQNVDVVVFGRKTYQLMESYWPAVAKNQSATKAVNDFARTIDSLNKVVFSKTLVSVEWKNTTISRANLQDEISKLKRQPGKDISIGGLSIASQLTEIGLIDEYHFVVQPIVAGKGPRLLDTGSLSEQLQLKLVGSTTFHSGVVALHYKTIPS